MISDDWWYPFFVVHYRRDTRHLTLAQDGAYRRLIDEYMLTREALPNNDAALSRILGISTTEWSEIAPVVRKFFKPRNDKLTHKRCERELRRQDARNKANSERGKKAALVRWSKNNGFDASRMLAPARLHNKYKNEPSEQDPAKGSAEGEHPDVLAFRARRAARGR